MFVNDEANGHWMFFDEDGVLLEEGKIKEGEREGYWRHYHGGLLCCEGPYEKGKKYGTWKMFDAKGKIKPLVKDAH